VVWTAGIDVPTNGLRAAFYDRDVVARALCGIEGTQRARSIGETQKTEAKVGKVIPAKAEDAKKDADNKKGDDREEEGGNEQDDG
jgi:hypothetical protein